MQTPPRFASSEDSPHLEETAASGDREHRTPSPAGPLSSEVEKRSAGPESEAIDPEKGASIERTCGLSGADPAPKPLTESRPERPAARNLRRLSRVTCPSLVQRKLRGEKITALTAYDYTTAVLLDESGVEVILVGDSLSSIVQGQETTLPVTVDEMVYHTRCVSRGVRRALLVADLPFLSYRISPEQALENAGRLVKEGGAHAVKLEGGVQVRAAIAKIVSAEIPVIGHVGLMPQSFHRMGGYKVQGRRRAKGGDRQLPGDWEQVLEDALAVEEAGASAVVLECIPPDLARTITEQLTIPTIGIGAGPACDGQILVTADLLGLSISEPPKFVKVYAHLGSEIRRAVGEYVDEVKAHEYPNKKFSYEAVEENHERIQKNVAIQDSPGHRDARGSRI